LTIRGVTAAIVSRVDWATLQQNIANRQTDQPNNIRREKPQEI